MTETPTNPTLKLTDIAAISAIAKEHAIPHAVDNTFLTPYYQRPIELGADLVMHSTTKYLDGHNATVGGAVVSLALGEGPVRFVDELLMTSGVPSARATLRRASYRRSRPMPRTRSQVTSPSSQRRPDEEALGKRLVRGSKRDDKPGSPSSASSETSSLG